MPTPTTQQTNAMPIYEGIAPGLDSDNFIKNIAYKRNIVPKTTSYTLLGNESGTEFTTTGAAGAVTFTLPAVASTPTGWECVFTNTVGQNMIVTAPANKLITFNNATATSVTFSTAGNLIGASVKVSFDGAFFLVHPYGANTMTVS